MQALISQLHKDRHYGQVSKDWIEKVRADGITAVEQIGSADLRLKKEKYNILKNSLTLAGERAKREECTVLLKMILQMKAKEAIEAKILKKGDELIAQWLQSMQFRTEMILSAEKGLKEIENKIIIAQGKGFELIRELHTESQANGQGKVLIDVNVMKENLSKFLDSLIDVTIGGPSKIAELQTLSG